MPETRKTTNDISDEVSTIESLVAFLPERYPHLFKAPCQPFKLCIRKDLVERHGHEYSEDLFSQYLAAFTDSEPYLTSIIRAGVQGQRVNLEGVKCGKIGRRDYCHSLYKLMLLNKANGNKKKVKKYSVMLLQFKKKKPGGKGKKPPPQNNKSTLKKDQPKREINTQTGRKILSIKPRNKKI